MCLDGADAVEVLLHLRGQGGKSLLDLRRLREDAPGDDPSEHGKNGKRGQQKQRQRGRLVEHEHEGDEAGESENEKKPRAHADHLADQRDVVDRARHEIAGRVAREKARALQFEVPVEALAQFVGDGNAYLAHMAPPEIEGGVAQHHEAEDRKRGHEKARVARGDPVDARLEEKRHEGFEQPPGIDEGHAAPEASLVAMDERHQPPERAGAGFSVRPGRGRARIHGE